LQVLPGRSPASVVGPASPAKVVPEKPPEEGSPPSAAKPSDPAGSASATLAKARTPSAWAPDEATTPGPAVVPESRSPSQAAGSAQLARPASEPIPQHRPMPAAALAHPLNRAWPEILPAGDPAQSSDVPSRTVPLAPNMPTEDCSARWTAGPADLSPPAAEVLPEDWSPPAVVPDHPAASASEMLPEDWSAPSDVAADFPPPSAPEGRAEDRPPPTADAFVSLPSRILPESKWRLTVALPNQVAPVRPMPVSAPVPAAPSLARPVFSTADSVPYRSPSATMAERAARSNSVPRLVARAGAAREAVVQAGGATQLVMRRPVLPPARVRWSIVLLAGVASAVTVACLSWLFDPPSPIDVPIEASTAVQPDAGAAAQEATPRQALAATPTRTQPGSPPQAMIGLLTQRGDAALAVGDIIAARLLYERAAAMGSATAATAAGKTYDLDFLLRADTHGIRPDAAAAATWYRRAVALGDPEARTLLGRLEVQNRP
jgi:hypothetical protein